MSRLKAILGIFVFAGGAVAGILGAQLVSPAPPANPWNQLATVPEPAGSANVAALLVADDAKGLAKAMDAQLLQKLAQAIEPLRDIDEIFFTGATESRGDILSAYVAGGRAQSGDKVIVGVVLRVRDGKVVGVN